MERQEISPVASQAARFLINDASRDSHAYGRVRIPTTNASRLKKGCKETCSEFPTKESTVSPLHAALLDAPISMRELISLHALLETAKLDCFTMISHFQDGSTSSMSSQMTIIIQIIKLTF